MIESCDIGMGYAAMSAMDLLDETNADALIATANGAMSEVATGQISTAVRNATINGVEIKEGEFIGFIGKRMVTSEPLLADAARALIDSLLIGGDKYMLTVFSGAELSDADAAAVEEYLSERYEDVECFFVPGGQEIYPLIIVAE